jgi:hypothetical protein
MERRQRRETLTEALRSLPERCREVMLLRYLDGCSGKEIAARLGISLGTVKGHLLKGVRDAEGQGVPLLLPLCEPEDLALRDGDSEQRDEERGNPADCGHGNTVADEPERRVALADFGGKLPFALRVDSL